MGSTVDSQEEGPAFDPQTGCSSSILCGNSICQVHQFFPTVQKPAIRLVGNTKLSIMVFEMVEQTN